MSLNQTILEDAEAFLNHEVNPTFKSALRALIDAAKRGDLASVQELQDRFKDGLRFGTAGIRAKMESGSCRYNTLTVLKATWALYQSFREANLGELCIFIGYDGRMNSRDYARAATDLLTHFGVRVEYFDFQIATPVTAFMAHTRGANAGIMITASHNPPADNGYKVYGSNGAQLSREKTDSVEQWMLECPSWDELAALAKQPRRELQTELQASELQPYFDAVQKAVLLSTKEKSEKLSVSYTALHGVGSRFFHSMAKLNPNVVVHPVTEQAEPNGAFPTLLYPNPEDPNTLKLVLENAERNNADLVLANDPDADRVAVAVRIGEKKYRILTGNELGTILGHDAITRFSASDCLVASTLVSSRMLSCMAKASNIHYCDALTGFSNIAEKTFALEKAHKHQFHFAYEEALGFLVGSYIRDKDGISAAMRLIELAHALKCENKTLLDRLDELYRTYGLFMSDQLSYHVEGLGSEEKSLALMRKLRAQKPNFEQLGFLTELSWRDLNEDFSILGQTANILIAESSSERLLVRPSGTEPKIKFYLELNQKLELGSNLENEKQLLQERLNHLKKSLKNWLSSL